MFNMLTSGLKVLTITVAAAALSPRLPALTVTQSASIDITGYAQGTSSYNFARMMAITPFDATLGQLQSVVISANLSAHVSTLDYNIWLNGPRPDQFITPSVGISAHLSSADGGYTQPITATVMGPNTLWKSGTGLTFDSDVALSLHLLVTDSADLARYSDTGTFYPGAPRHLVDLTGYVFGTPSYWGGVTGVGGGTMTVTYNYAPAAAVPDYGAPSYVLAAFGLVALVTCNGLSNRTQKGCQS